MKYVGMETGPDGLSHFVEHEVEMASDPAMSAVTTATGFLFRRTEPSRVQDYHNAPRKQFIVCLGGAMEFENADGVRRFGPGDVVLAADTTGKGHIARFQSAEFILIHVPD